MQNLRYSFLLIVLSLALFLPGLVHIPMLDRDSARFAQASRQMLETKQYAQIKFQNEPRHLKPPGIYWLQALSVATFSHADSIAVWPYRIPALLGALFAVIFTFFLVEQVLTKNIAFIAAIFLAESALLNIEVRQTVTDAVFLVPNLLMLGSLWIIYHKTDIEYKNLNGWIFLFWLSMALGVLIKGLSPALALVILIVTICVDRELNFLKQLKLGWGFLGVVMLTLAWLIPISQASHSNFLLDMIQKDVLPKIIGGQESHGMPPGYFAFIFTVMFWPNSIFFFKGLDYLIQNFNIRAIRFLTLWGTSIWILFECIPTKLPEYILPSYPAVAILLALSVFEHKEFKNHYFYWFDKIYAVIWLIVSLIMASGLILITAYFQLPNHQALYIAGFVAFILNFIVFLLYIKKSHLNLIVLQYCTTLILYFAIFSLLIPQLDFLWLSKRVAHLIEDKQVLLSKEHPLMVFDYHEPSMVFYLGTQRIIFLSSLGTINKNNLVTLCKTKPCYFLVPKEKLFLNSLEDFNFLGTISGLNYSNGEKLNLELLSYDSHKK